MRLGFNPAAPQLRRPGKRIQNGSPNGPPNRPPNGPPDGSCGGSPNPRFPREGCVSVLDSFGDPIWIRFGSVWGVPGLGPKRIPKQIQKRINNASLSRETCARGSAGGQDTLDPKTHFKRTPKRTSNALSTHPTRTRKRIKNASKTDRACIPNGLDAFPHACKTDCEKQRYPRNSRSQSPGQPIVDRSSARAKQQRTIGDCHRKFDAKLRGSTYTPK